ncbi:MAG: RelA/SpoT family protein [Methyloligellaceae bacterium]
MMRQYELVERVLQYDPHADEDLLNRAYVYAMKAHGHQTRASGDPYFSHPLEVAAILTELRLDDATIATALLHDTIEDTEVTRSEIDELFGQEIGSLVEGLTKIDELDLVSKKAEQAENFRKLLVAITSDIRVLLVKLADRLHNMRTLEHMRLEKRGRIAEETMDIYAPLAGRMGMQWLRDELENLSFKWINPEAFETVVDRLTLLKEKNSGLIDEIIEDLQERLELSKISGRVTGREKKPYSIWNKMERKQISLEQLSDIFAFRIIVDTVEDCYRVLGAIHTHWRMVPGRFKDYISNSKQNDYQSIHTTIIGPRHQRVELQIRTEKMHSIAEYGVAAHALYKEDVQEIGNGEIITNKNLRSYESNAYQWLRRLVDMLLEGDNPEEFLEHTKLELFQDQVFCFTPNGRLIALPRGATPIDFAYAVHTDIGNSCVGSKINGLHMPLVTQLNNGDEVEIMTSQAQTPPPAWEKIAVTGKARSAIRRATREARRRQYSDLGRQILSRACRRIEKEIDEINLNAFLHKFSQKSVDDIFVAVGRGELASSDVFKVLFPEAREEPQPKRPAVQRHDEGWFNLRKVIGLKFRMPGSQAKNRADEVNGIPIRGHQAEFPVDFAEGGAVPGDRIVGIMTSGEGMKIYPIHSPTLEKYDDEPERWVDVTWDIEESNSDRFLSQIEVTAINEPGSLAKIANFIGETDGNIDTVQMIDRAPDFTNMLIRLEVWDLKHLNQIISGLRRMSVVSRVTRNFGEAKVM